MQMASMGVQKAPQQQCVQRAAYRAHISAPSVAAATHWSWKVSTSEAKKGK